MRHVIPSHPLVLARSLVLACALAPALLLAATPSDTHPSDMTVAALQPAMGAADSEPEASQLALRPMAELQPGTAAGFEQRAAQVPAIVLRASQRQRVGVSRRLSIDGCGMRLPAELAGGPCR